MNEIPLFPNFKVLELSDRQEIEKITAQFPPYSDYHFPIMWSWDIHDSVKISILNSNLIVFHSDCVTAKSFFSIVGTGYIQKTIEELNDYIYLNDSKTTIKWIPEEVFQLASEQSILFKEDRDNHDYIYDIEKLNSAVGNKFSVYRNNINRFLRENKVFETKLLDINQSQTQIKLIEVFNQWIITKKQKKQLVEPHEFYAFSKLLKSANNFNSIKVLTLFVKDELVAFSIIDFMNSEYACIPFTKSNINYGSKFLMKEVVSFLHQNNIKYLNFEPDVGIPSLRFSKLLYRPANFLKKYSVEITC